MKYIFSFFLVVFALNNIHAQDCESCPGSTGGGSFTFQPTYYDTTYGTTLPGFTSDPYDSGQSSCGWLMYRDADGDGFGTSESSCIYNVSSPSMNGYSLKTGDCDDSNPDLYPKYWYLDGDADGYGDVNQRFRFISCYPPNPYYFPGNYVTNYNDCDDSNPLYNIIRKWYLDSDNDTYGDPYEYVKSCSPPDHYVDDNTDCNDSDETIHIYKWYKDYDQDGLGDPLDFVLQCNPAHEEYWVLNGDDLCPDNRGEIEDQGCPREEALENWNTIKVTTYDAQETEKSKTKSYYDCLGKGVQTLSVDYKTNTTWANETHYDKQGRAALQTLSAPAYPGEVLIHKQYFVRKQDGSQYTRADFDTNPEEPQPVGDTEYSLGWYYSNNNTNEALQDITSYPFSKTSYSTLNPGAALRNLGGNKAEDEWKNGYTFSMKAGQELGQEGAFNDPSYNSDHLKVIKTVSRDVHGVENVVFTDTDGKVLAAARSGGDDWRTTKIDFRPEDQSFVDVHVPVGTIGFDIIKHSIIQVEVFDLITETKVTTPTTSLPNGFYRVAVTNLEDFITAGVTISCKENYYDYSLNYYDEVGRLISAKQPLNHIESTYEYNTLGQLIKTTSPDEGTARFKYRKDGQIRYSQNSKQEIAREISYTNYDNLGRPVESGVLVIENPDFDFETMADPDEPNLPEGSRREQQFTQYDTVDNNELIALGIDDSYHNPEFLASNVAKTQNDQTTTYYSYDAYGRVQWLVQDITGLETKTIDYEYDDLTGNVNRVLYQKHTPTELFIHRYNYDPIDYSLTKVETSTDNSTYTEHATYTYYETGALKNVQLAGGIQQIDYVYNLNGQLKAINHPNLNNDNSGSNENDIFGMTIDYHSDDYKRSTAFSNTVGGTNQFNGNIKGITWNTGPASSTSASQYTYEYNRNNWLKEATFSSPGVPYPKDYNVSGITYDANGNILSLNRNKHTENNTNAMDTLTYNYSDPAKPNQLTHVHDEVTTPPNAPDIKSQDPGNYTYNSIGQLISNAQDDIAYTYNASGLVTEVSKLNGTPLVKFYYDDKGKRLKKESFVNGALQNTTYYVRDASGSPLAIYTNNVLKEHPIYGASRLGVFYRNTQANSGVTAYQLTDHLGNVRAVIMKEGENALSLTSKTDYYPFGMPMPGPDNVVGDYRYAYQGQEKDPETGKEAFELRLWDSRIGRWLTTDPYGEFSSPYLGMGNNPVRLTDPDGGKTNDEWLVNADGSTTWLSNRGGSETQYFHFGEGHEFSGQTAIALGNFDSGLNFVDMLSTSSVGINTGIDHSDFNAFSNSRINQFYTDRAGYNGHSEIVYHPITKEETYGAFGAIKENNIIFDVLTIRAAFKGIYNIFRGVPKDKVLGGASRNVGYFTDKAVKAGYSTALTGARVKAGVFVQIHHNVARVLNGRAIKVLYSNSAASAAGRQMLNNAYQSSAIQLFIGGASTYNDFGN